MSSIADDKTDWSSLSPRDFTDNPVPNTVVKVQLKM